MLYFCFRLDLWKWGKKIKLVNDCLGYCWTALLVEEILFELLVVC